MPTSYYIHNIIPDAVGMIVGLFILNVHNCVLRLITRTYNGERKNGFNTAATKDKVRNGEMVNVVRHN